MAAVRCGRSVKVMLVAEVAAADVEIVEDEFDFGGKRSALGVLWRLPATNADRSANRRRGRRESVLASDSRQPLDGSSIYEFGPH